MRSPTVRRLRGCPGNRPRTEPDTALSASIPPLSVRRSDAVKLVVILHQLAEFALFPTLAERALHAEGNRAVDRDRDAPPEQRPVEPPVTATDEINREQERIDHEVDDQMSVEPFDLLNTLARLLVPEISGGSGLHHALLSRGQRHDPH